MRNISFDESTVLNELVKIAHDKGLIADASYAFLKSQNPIRDAMVYLDTYWADLMKKPNADYKKMQPVYDQEKVRVIAALKNVYKAQATNPQYLAAMQNFEQQAAKISTPEAGGDSVEPIFGRGSVEQPDVKTAEEKIYDVSGETGKDLIDAAHPDTAIIEVSNSKTTENVVENIFEQQERDIEVVNKVPKGTYASLMNLYKDLEKNGHKEILPELDDLIKSIATEEDEIVYALVNLANELDARGLYKQADEIDAMFKKKASDPSVLKSELIEALLAEVRYNQQYSMVPGKQAKLDALVQEIKNVNFPTFSQTINAIKPIIAKHLTDLPGISKTFWRVAGQFNAELQQEIAARPQQPASKPGEQKPVDKVDWTKDAAKVKQWQFAFNNEMEKAYGKRPLMEDGIMGPQTNSARKYLRTAGGWKQLPAYIKSIKDRTSQTDGVAGIKQPGPAQAVPAAPAGPKDYTRYEDIRNLIEASVIEKLGPAGKTDVKSNDFVRWINEKATGLYNDQGREGKDGAPKYTPGEVANRVKDIVKNM